MLPYWSLNKTLLKMTQLYVVYKIYDTGKLKIKGQGAWLAQSVECTFDLRVVSLSPHIGDRDY